MKNLIVRGVTRKTRERGYVDPVEERVNQLGYKGLFGFVVLEEEVVPADIVISMGAFGDANNGCQWQGNHQ